LKLEADQALLSVEYQMIAFDDVCHRIRQFEKMEYLSIQAPFISQQVLSSLSQVV
jgi:hypothetical protein